jgi:Tol biopolymer transport system component
LTDLLCLDGIGAPENSARRRLVVSVLATVLGVLALMVVPALAAAEKPVIISESVSEVTAESAHLNVVVIPNGESACHFQYGTLLVSENEAPCGKLLGSEETTLSVEVFGLTPGATYKYRFILTNVSGTTEGAVAEFVAIAPETPEGIVGEATPAGVKLEGILNPKNKGNPGPYEFLYRPSATECTGPGGGATPAEESTGAQEEQVKTLATGLLPNTVYTFCLRAGGEGGPVSLPVTLRTLAVAPTVGGESFSNVGSASAELHAHVDPGGAPTSYFFEYGATPAYGSRTPVASAGAGAEAVSVLAKLEGLRPDTTYYFHVVADNAHAVSPVEGGQATFSTFPTGILGLPDSRGYELVSPLENPSEDGNVTVGPGTPAQSSPDGGTVAYLASAGAEGGNGNVGGGGGIRPHGVNVYLAKRAGRDGWSAVNIQPNGLNSARYQGFSSDLSTGFLGSNQPLTENGPAGPALYARDSDGSYRLLSASNAKYAGSTPDGHHILVDSSGSLYDSVAGELEPVSVLPGPGGGVAPNATFGSTKGDLERVISDDGSRIFWTDRSTGDLYVRENASQPNASTVLVAEGAQFQTASSDGSKVFFTDEKPLLTTDSTAATGAPDLYEYDLATGNFTDLSVDSLSGHADVVGVLGSSADGSYVYFAAAGALLNGVTPQKCLPIVKQESSTKCNIYVVHNRGVQFVATVTDVDGEGGLFSLGEVRGHGDWVSSVGERTAHVSPDGRHLVFWSTESLTGFEGGGPEIYMYDYGSSVTCVSCNPTGVPTHPVPSRYYVETNLPESDNPTYQSRDLSPDGDRVFFESSEALVSQFPNGEVVPPLYTGGFNTGGLSNVYEWERVQDPSHLEPNDSCTREAPSFSAANGGCLYLLSGGTSPDASFFVDASENGEDVFFETRAQLVPQDRGEVYELYDARVGATPPPAEPSCTGAGCQGVPAAPPIFATPSSVTFNGVGNFPPPPPRLASKKMIKCAKGRALSHGKCVMVKHKRKAHMEGCLSRGSGDRPSCGRGVGMKGCRGGSRGVTS